MSAIVIRPAPAPAPPLRRPKSAQNSKGRSPDRTAQLIDRSSEHTPLLAHHGVTITSASGVRTPLYRSEPLKHSLSRSRFVLLLAGVWSANFVIAFQAMAVPTTAPAIGSWFGHAELSSLLGSMFVLSNTAVIPLYGVFMDTLGRKFAMITACALYGIGTILCALSPNMYALIAARVVAGLGGGGMLTCSSVIVTDLVPLRDRGLYQGIMMVVFGAGSMLGGPTAGWLVDHLGWPSSFWVQLPVAIFCMAMVYALLPPARIPPTHESIWAGLASLDWAGTVLLIGSVTTLILGLSAHTSYLLPWSAPIVWGNLLAAILAGILLVLVEKRVERPVVPLGMFRDRHTAAVLMSGFFMSVVSQAFMFQVPMYFAVILNTSTAQAGLMLSLTMGFGQAVGSMYAGQKIRQGGRYRTMGLVWLVPPIICSFIAARWNPSWTIAGYYATAALPPLGYSVFLCVNLVALISAVDSQMMPRATALLYTTRTLGSTLGISLGGSVQIGVLAHQLRHHLPSSPTKQDTITSILHSKDTIRRLAPHIQAIALKAYGKSLSVVWIGCGFIACLTLFSAFWMEERDMGSRDDGGVERGKWSDAALVNEAQGETL